MKEEFLNERGLFLLKSIVDLYIRDGQPVSSKALAQHMPMVLSSATIRHIMADLEEQGFLSSPHTSAGRIPTNQAYRYFVDSLLTVNPLNERTTPALEELGELIEPISDMKSLLAQASETLAKFTQFAGIVTLPKRERCCLRQVEFLPLSGNRILVILIVNEKEVQNRILQTARVYTQSELEQASNFLTQMFAGKELSDIHRELLTAMETDKERLHQSMQTTIDIAGQAFRHDDTQQEYVIAGQSNLLSLADISGVDSLRGLFEAFTQKRDILYLLDQCIQADGVSIFIGEESGYAALDACSMVSAPYQIEGQVVGVLGVIGPTRMPYDKVISIVDVTAKLLNAALKKA